MKDPTIKQDPKAWEAGYAAGLAGRTGEAPRGVDGLAWQSGLIEGKADGNKPPADRKPRRRPVRSQLAPIARQAGFAFVSRLVQAGNYFPRFRNCSAFPRTPPRPC